MIFARVTAAIGLSTTAIGIMISGVVATKGINAYNEKKN